MRVVMALLFVVLGSAAVLAQTKPGTSTTAAATKPVPIQKYIESLPKDYWPSKDDTAARRNRRYKWYSDHPGRVIITLKVDEFSGGRLVSDGGVVSWFGEKIKVSYRIQSSEEGKDALESVKMGATIKVEATISTVTTGGGGGGHSVELIEGVLLK